MKNDPRFLKLQEAVKTKEQADSLTLKTAQLVDGKIDERFLTNAKRLIKNDFILKEQNAKAEEIRNMLKVLLPTAILQRCGTLDKPYYIVWPEGREYGL